MDSMIPESVILTGIDLMAVPELLGHEWLPTTMRYVHVSRITSRQPGWPGKPAPPRGCRDCLNNRRRPSRNAGGDGMGENPDAGGGQAHPGS